MRVRVTAPVMVVFWAIAWCLPGITRAQDVTNVHDPTALHLQLPSFMAPVQAPDGTRTSAAVTLFVEVRTPGEARDVCRLVPRIQDAVLQNLFARPVPQGEGNHMDLTGIGERLTIAVNKSLGRHVAIVDVHAFEGILVNDAAGTKFTRWQTCRSLSR